VAVVSFTGSRAVGRMIARVGGVRLAKVCLELGGRTRFAELLGLRPERDEGRAGSSKTE
jgi:Aldehyde dehydrogenase family